MIAKTLDELRTLRQGLHSMYSDPGATAGQIRYEHLNTVVRLTPLTMAASVGSASLVLWAFRGDWTAGLLAWWTVLVLLAVLGLANWRRLRQHTRHAVSCSGIRRSTWHAALLAATWSIMPVLWFADATPGRQLVIATLITGMMGAGTFVLGPLPWACVTYVSLFTLSSIWSLLSAPEPMMAGVVVLLGFYAPMVLVGGLASWRKSTAFLLAQNEAIRQEQMLSVVLHDFEQNAADALWEADAQGRLRQPSERLASLLQTSPEDLTQLSLPERLRQLASAQADALEKALNRGVPFHQLAVTLGQSESARHLAINGKPLTNELGEPAGWRGVLTDRSSEVSALAQLQQLAHTDSLTQLANRFAMHLAIERQLQRPPRAGHLLLIDLDHFKAINDSFGHSVGDALLTQVAHRLRQAAPQPSTVARLGGDEFALLLPATASHSGDSSMFVNTLASQLIQDLSHLTQADARRFRMGASIGIAELSPDVESVDDLLVRADLALYAAKARGRGQATHYSADLRTHSRRRSAIEEGLRSATQGQQLSLHWQPLVALDTGRISGAEALMRWHHPQLGAISPGEFIPIAEQAGLIGPLGLWALQQACASAMKELQGIEVSVNVSANQLAAPQFVETVQSVLEATGLPASRLTLEITESVLMEDTTTHLGQLHALRALGVRIALDDFGTGYSSLSYLCRFPFDTLKIDRSFVQEAMERPQALAVVHTITHLAQILGMKTVCEGVETRAQMKMVRDAGIHKAQGYLLSRPLPLDRFNALLQAWQAHDSPTDDLITGMAPLWSQGAQP
ncbi:EAL domain-containing protein [Curvibacter sp. RS43]|uniref:putative bifunctional diguanylate cyclase/phosphodiesterase n=1 Tax=Curvibacter microcysteis TaxID=3026419 RepID=UPI002362120E|nr:EAL domain-containing protein [Curvibacter sp. RS43]MDD0809708.1 EAL domain-containing protein [Curvibacter sp. RS43]